MKKLLIVNNNMHIGGVQKALVNLLEQIHADYDVTLLLFCKVGENLSQIPADVKILTADSAYKYLGMSRKDVSGWKEKLGRFFYAGLTRTLGRKYAVALMRLGQTCCRGYDVAISYFHNSGDKSFYGGCNEFVIYHTDAPKKVSFLHGDYILCGGNTPQNAKLYKKFDCIAACSGGCADTLIKGLPELKEKVTVVKNCLGYDEIRRQAALAPVTMDKSKINIVTVARLGKEKGVERALQVIADLKEYQPHIHYYIIGDGIQRPLIQEIIQKQQLSHCVTLCGSLSNPYGYIKAADLLLIPSYSEAAPMVIGEAACLGTPILSTKTSSATEMIRDTGFGWVCENSEAGMYRELKALLADPSAIQKKTAWLSEQTLSDEAAVSQFSALIDPVE